MIKVLNVVIDNHIGGIQNRILSIGNDLKRQGIQSIVLAPNSEGDFLNIAQNSGFKVYQASIESPKFFTSFKNVLKNILWILKFPAGVIETIRIIKREDVDIVHVNGLLALHAVFAARITGTPIIWHLISTIYPQLLVNTVRPIYNRWANQIVFITNNTRKYYLGVSYSQKQIRIIYEPVDLEYFNKNQITDLERENIYQKYGFDKEYNVIGFVGNINPQKGLERFLQVAKELKITSCYKLKFLIVGEASTEYTDYAKKLKEIVKNFGLEDDIIFTGKVSNLREVMSIMDIFLMTSRSEGTPLVILEAMAMEIPVVAPDVGGISEQISDGETGFVVPPKDIEATFKSLQMLLNDPDLREEMGRMGRERVRSLFSLEKCIQSHRDLYLEMMEHGK
jgi:glycosyltransferase involved in cell wall biosynthesis